MSSAKRKNTKLRRALKKEPCDACGVMGTDWNPVDPAHVRTFKVTQSDHPANIISLCRSCHNRQHRSGWKMFLWLFPKVEKLLKEKGWEISEHPFTNSVILTHPEIK